MSVRQRPTITHWISCDVCGDDAGDEQSQAAAERRDQAAADGFVRADDGRDLCPACAVPDTGHVRAELWERAE